MRKEDHYQSFSLKISFFLNPVIAKYEVNVYTIV